jgi:hypothetical protein
MPDSWGAPIEPTRSGEATNIDPVARPGLPSRIAWVGSLWQLERGSLVELVEQQPATRCVVGSIPAGSALEVWPWTSVLN